MTLIPASGKPIDLKLSDIKTESDAQLVVEWLDATISDMQRQLDNLDGDDAWRKRVLAAMRKTGETRVKIVEKMIKARHELDLSMAFQDAAERMLPKDLYEKVLDEAKASKPDLSQWRPQGGRGRKS